MTYCIIRGVLILSLYEQLLHYNVIQNASWNEPLERNII